MKKAFTLIEMLVVVAIVAILIGGSIGAYSKMRASAEKAKCRELVSNVATALTALYQEKGAWPRVLREGGGGTGAQLDERRAYPLASGNYLTLRCDQNAKTLSGYDRFGIVSPWAQAVIKRRGDRATVSDLVPSGGNVKDHILYYALDLDGDGIIDGASIGGASVPIRAVCAVWSCGKDGKVEAYSTKSLRSDDVYSWSHGQTNNVK